MRTYEVTVQVVRYEKVLVEHPNRGLGATHDAGLEALEKIVTAEGEHAKVWHTTDITPQPPTDKQRFNAAFRELRELGYKARQGLSPLDDGVEVYTTREDVVDAFRDGELTGMIPVHWDYVDHENTNFHNHRVSILTSVFEEHGFSVEWEGRFYNALQIRADKEGTL